MSREFGGSGWAFRNADVRGLRQRGQMGRAEEEADERGGRWREGGMSNGAFGIGEGGHEESEEFEELLCARRRSCIGTDEEVGKVLVEDRVRMSELWTVDVSLEPRGRRHLVRERGSSFSESDRDPVGTMNADWDEAGGVGDALNFDVGSVNLDFFRGEGLSCLASRA